MKNENSNGIELLAPAGSFEKMKIAIHYGADAVYGGTADFSLRARGGGFSLDELKEAVIYAHSKNARFYLTLNSFLREPDIDAFARLAEKAAGAGVDAFIISDPGGIMAARSVAPEVPVHLSTQGNNLNSQAINFWAAQSVSRVILARELSIEEIRLISSKVSMQLECFIHGALCIAYSGRCMLSLYNTGRDANRGDCTHPCRWSYELLEEKRQEPFLVEEDRHGTYFFNSKDLCTINIIPQILDAGVTSLKIEGRMKTVNYLASVVAVYRAAIDAYTAGGCNKTPRLWIDELEKVNTRGYTSGFLAETEETMQHPDKNSLSIVHRYLGLVTGKLDGGRLLVVSKNPFNEGDVVEIFSRGLDIRRDRVVKITDYDGERISKTRPGSTVIVTLETGGKVMDIIRLIVF